MSPTPKCRILLQSVALLVVLFLLGHVPVSGQIAAPVSQPSGPHETDVGPVPEAPPHDPAPIRPAAPSACPAGPADLPEEIERDKFCVFYTTDSITHDEAAWAADWVEDYWDRFVALGFNEPKYSGKLEVHLLDIPGDCNGSTGWGWNRMTTYAGCFSNAEWAQKVLGHELTHRGPVQSRYLHRCAHSDRVPQGGDRPGQRGQLVRQHRQLAPGPELLLLQRPGQSVPPRPQQGSHQ